MTITEITRINQRAGEPSTNVEDKIKNITQVLKELGESYRFTIGTTIQEKNTLQITSEWDGFTSHSSLQTSPEFQAFRKALNNIDGEIESTYHIVLNHPAFEPEGVATAPVVEFVHNHFPISRATPEFRKKIDEDFLKFNDILLPALDGSLGVVFGWTLGEYEHEEIKGEKAAGFLVMRGWKNMANFEEAVKSEVFGKAMPIVLAWNMPWKMWHVERKF